MKMYGDKPPPKRAHNPARSRRLQTLMRELSEDSESDDEPDGAGRSQRSSHQSSSDDITHPWRKEFLEYLSSTEEVPENMPLVRWWGVSASLWWYTRSCVLTSAVFRLNHIAGQFGLPLPVTIWLYKPPPYRANVHSRRVDSLSQIDGLVSKVM